jgi:CDP-paratose 2-epimerase
MKVLVTGSSGLIGSEAVLWFDRQGHNVVGVDNNMSAPRATRAGCCSG